jgi:hypothetical protein
VDAVANLREVPGQELLDAVDRMVGDAGQHVSEIRFGVEAVDFGRANQAVDRGGALAASIGAGEQVVLAAQSDAAQSTIGGIVSLDAAVVHVAQQRFPARERAAHRQRRVAIASLADRSSATLTGSSFVVVLSPSRPLRYSFREWNT